MRTLRITLFVCTTICFVLTMAINLIGTTWQEAGRAIGLFKTESGQFNRTAESPLGPVPWAFSIWGLIYLFQISWFVYGWTTVFRRLHPDSDFLCCDPGLLPIGLMVGYFFSCLCNMAWLIVADRVEYQKGLALPELRIPQFLLLFGITAFLYVALISSYWSLALAKDRLCEWNRRLEYWLTVVLVQNGISLYAGWVTVATFLNLDTMLIALTNLKESEVSSTIAISFLIGLIGVYAIADLTVIDPLTRFVFTPHLVVAWACMGSLVLNFDNWTRNNILVTVLLVLVLLALVVKIVLVVVRSRTSPMLRTKISISQKESRLGLDDRNSSDAGYSNPAIKGL